MEKKTLSGEHVALAGIVVACIVAFCCVVYTVNALVDMQSTLAAGTSFWDAVGAGHPKLASGRVRSMFCVFLIFLVALVMGAWGVIKWRDDSFSRKNPSSVLETTILMQQKEIAALRRLQSASSDDDEDEGQFTDESIVRHHLKRRGVRLSFFLRL